LIRTDHPTARFVFAIRMSVFMAHRELKEKKSFRKCASAR
jgi:hypothetical protein